MKMEVDWLKRVRGVSQKMRRSRTHGTDTLALKRQSELAKESRATIYRQRSAVNREPHDAELLLCRLIDDEYTRRPFYGSRRM